MAIAGPATQHKRAGRDHRFHPLKIAGVVSETAEARSFVLEVPPGFEDAFSYRAGQFCTFRMRIDGRQQLRSYSMSSSPDVGDELAVTVKRVPDGAVSNWMIDTLEEGDILETTCPAGVFCLSSGDGEVLAFAAGSGITPVFSILKTALATTSRRLRLLYANRDHDSVIFRAQLAQLVDRYPERLEVVHHLDEDEGFVDAQTVLGFAGLERLATGTEHFICGPEPFMAEVEATLLEAGVKEQQIRIERFTPSDPGVAPEPSPTSSSHAPNCIVKIELTGRTDSVEHRPGTTILQTAREMGMAPPFSCESGNCATCMARLIEGAVNMRANNALTDEEVAEGWVLTCQSEPITPTVHVVYEEV